MAKQSGNLFKGPLQNRVMVMPKSTAGDSPGEQGETSAISREGWSHASVGLVMVWWSGGTTHLNLLPDCRF